ncbi:MAG: cell wall-active antibiotics response protein, partial [Gemmatimonadetes bacterium]|nr:cell wall-active antibiotics response protein [Gemmatimonadota bacterium]
RRIASVFSAIERDVAGPMPEILHVRAVMGSVELDLRDAEFPPGLTEIRVRSVMASVEIDLPDTVRIENDGKAFMGSWVVSSRRRRGRERPADGPLVRITGRSIMASVEVGVDD